MIDCYFAEDASAEGGAAHTLFIFQVGVGGALEAEGVTAGEGEHLTVGVTFMTDSLVVYALTIHRWKL